MADGLLSRLRTGVIAGVQAARNTSNIDQAKEAIDKGIESKTIPILSDIDSDIFEMMVMNGMTMDDIEKEFPKLKNKLKIHRTNTDLFSFHASVLRHSIGNLKDKNNLYRHGDPQRDFVLAEFWKQEPILSGAVYSMSAKMSTLTWTVVGKKRLATYYAGLYDGALSMNGANWGDFISATAQDFYTTDRGSFWITPRIGSHLTGKLAELGVMDSLACAMTGNMRKPVLYSSHVTGQDLWLRPGEYAHFASLVSPREELFGTGLCAVSRAYKAARILLGLSDYDWEKLNNLPPEGLAAISGLTQDEFQDSLALWRAARKKNQNLTYPQVLWLLGSQPNTTVGVDFVGFSEIPESFEREKVIEQYVNLLALVFGVDAREFWPISTSSLGTAAESEIQHMKAKGKGPGEIVAILERYLNGEQPDDVAFNFDTQDIAEDQASAEIAKAWIDAFMPLYNPNGGSGTGQGGFSPTGEDETATSPQPPMKGNGGVDQIITKDQFLRLLADRRVLPNWVVGDDRVIRTDLGRTEKEKQLLLSAEGDPDTPVVITWKAGSPSDGGGRSGTLHMELAPAYEMIQNTPSNDRDKYEAILLQSGGVNGSGGQSGSVLGDGSGLARLKQLADEIIELELERGIRGKPIPKSESLRGPKITTNTVEAEIERWRNHPILSRHVPTLDENEEIKDILETIQ